MVPPPNQSGTTIAHNPDGSVSEMTYGGMAPGPNYGPTNLVPIVAASSGSAVVHSVPGSSSANVQDAGTQGAQSQES
jgi:hypothetical protein